MSDKIFEVPTSFANSLSPSSIYFNTKRSVKVSWKLLKTKKTFTRKKVVNIPLWGTIQ